MNSFVASDAEPITPNDTANHYYDSIYVTGGGAVRFLSGRGRERTITFAANTFVPIRVTRVFATGTTATGIHGLVQ